MPRSSWRRIADLLAERLSHQADQCPEEHDPPDPDDCPFCADTVAYQTYLDAAGLERRKPSGEVVTISELMSRLS